jgi:hypothetical protein
LSSCSCSYVNNSVVLLSSVVLTNIEKKSSVGG